MANDSTAHHLSPINEASQETSVASSFASNRSNAGASPRSHPFSDADERELVERHHADWKGSTRCQHVPANCPNLKAGQGRLVCLFDCLYV